MTIAQQRGKNVHQSPAWGFECSECGWEAYVDDDYGANIDFDFNYCPQCGIPMEDADEDWLPGGRYHKDSGN